MKVISQPQFLAKVDQYRFAYADLVQAFIDAGVATSEAELPAAMVRLGAARNLADAEKKLAKVQGSDGQINSGAELERLFKLLDDFDSNRKRDSFDYTNDEGKVTTSGRIWDALAPKAERAVVSDRGMLADFDGFVLAPELFTAETRATLAELGILANIEKAAGKNNIISTPSAFRKVFKELRKLDNVDDRGSFEFNGVAKTTYEALFAERRLTDTYGRYRFDEDYGKGAFNLGALTEEQVAKLNAFEFDVARLRADAGTDGLVETNTERLKTFNLIDKLDENGYGGSFSLHEPYLPGETNKKLTPAGEALGILDTVFEEYEIAFPNYTDWSRARMAPADYRSFEVKNAAGDTVVHRLQGDTDTTDCFETVVAMVRAFNKDAARRVAGKFDAHYMARTEDGGGRVAGWSRDFDAGRSYIDHVLDLNRPVVVGLSHRDFGYNLDGITDHFVLIVGRGRDEDGRQYYTYVDTGTSNREYRKNKLYVDDQGGMLFRPPLGKGYLSGRAYQVTQVRPYSDISFESVTGREVTAAPPE